MPGPSRISQWHRFDGWVPPAQHVLTVYQVPALGFVEPGWIYVFTGMHESNSGFSSEIRGTVPGPNVAT